MKKTEEKVSTQRKTIIFIALFTILVVLPGISWFYLRGGLNWQKEALAEMRDFGKIRPAYIVYPDGEKQNQLKSKVVVIHIFGENPDLTEANKKILDTGQRLYDQFGDNEHFRMAMIADGGTAEFRSHAQTLPSADYAAWVWTGALGGWRTIVENGYESFYLSEKVDPVPQYYALADTSGTIRRFYDAMDDKQVGRMVEHIAMLLPKQ
jgi:hypothetical protein